MSETSSASYLRTLLAILAGCAGFTVLGVGIGWGISKVGDPTAAAAVPVVVCAACGFVAGGAFAAHIVLQAVNRQRAGAAATVVLLLLLVSLVASGALATSTGLPFFLFLPAGPVLAAFLGVQIAGTAPASQSST